MIYSHVPDWFTITCWVIGSILLLLVIWTQIETGFKKTNRRKCRSCNQRKEHMAITYGEDEGLCRICFDDIIPYATREPNPDRKGEDNDS